MWGEQRERILRIPFGPSNAAGSEKYSRTQTLNIIPYLCTAGQINVPNSLITNNFLDVVTDLFNFGGPVG